MKIITPTITGITPGSPIVINVAEGEVFGESSNLQLQVNLVLDGKISATAVVSLEIISPQLYSFSDGTSRRQYHFPMAAQSTVALLDFKIKNLAFFAGAQPALDIGVFAWDQATGDSIKRSYIATVGVTLIRPGKLKFKKLL